MEGKNAAQKKPVQNTEQTNSDFQAFWGSHNYGLWSPVFNSRLDAMIDNPDLRSCMRLEACVVRYSWGNWSDVVVGQPGGKPWGITDLAKRLKLSRHTVSDDLEHLRKCSLATQNKRVIGCVDPQKEAPMENPVRDRVPPVSPYLRYKENWLKEHSKEAEELKQARATVKRIDQAILRDYDGFLKENSEKAKNGFQPLPKTPDIRAAKRGDTPAKNGGTPSGNFGPSLYRTENRRTTTESSSSCSGVDGQPDEMRMRIPLSVDPPESAPPAVSLIPPVLNRLRYHWPATTMEQARRLVTGVLSHAPDATSAEVIEKIDIEAAGADVTRVRNLADLLAKKVPAHFEGGYHPITIPASAFNIEGRKEAAKEKHEAEVRRLFFEKLKKRSNGHEEG